MTDLLCQSSEDFSGRPSVLIASILLEIKNIQGVGPDTQLSQFLVSYPSSHLYFISFCINIIKTAPADLRRSIPELHGYPQRVDITFSVESFLD